MKRGSGMKGRDEWSRGIVTHIVYDFAIIKPRSPFRLAKHEDLRKRNWSDSSDNSLVKKDAANAKKST